MRSLWRTLGRETLTGVALVCLADAVVGLSFGTISVAGGLPAWQPVLMSLVVFAGGAQFAAVGVVLAGGSASAGVLAALVVNARLVPFGFAVGDLVGGRWPRGILGSHLVVDESVAFAMRESDPARRRAVFWVCGVMLFVVWNCAVLSGVWLGSSHSNTGQLGLDAAFPAVLLALVLPSLTRRVRPAAVTGAVVAVAATTVLPAGLPVLAGLAGLVLLGRAREPS